MYKVCRCKDSIHYDTYGIISIEYALCRTDEINKCKQTNPLEKEKENTNLTTTTYGLTGDFFVELIRLFNNTVMNNKENIPTTPKSKESRIISAVSPINNQTLKPISPNKEKNQIGKLNF